jgi:UDP:flavonoid glycosyltransferase YjiC (YdhE family)
VYLARTNVTADTLRSAVHRVLGDPSFRESRRRARTILQAAGGAGRGADAILAFVR